MEKNARDSFRGRFFAPRRAASGLSDRVWEKTHRLAGYVFVVAGFFLAVTGLIGAQSGPLMLAPGIVIGAAALLLVVYSYVEWRREGSAGRASSI